MYHFLEPLPYVTISSASTRCFPAPVALHLQTVSFAESDTCKQCRRRSPLFLALGIPVGSQESWKYDAPRFRVRLKFIETWRSASGVAACGPEHKQTIYKTVYIIFFNWVCESSDGHNLEEFSLVQFYMYMCCKILALCRQNKTVTK